MSENANALVLNLAYRTDRWEHVQKQWGGHFSLDPVRIDIHPCGSIGTLRAHRQALVQFASRKKSQWVCILHDNAVPIEHFTEFWSKVQTELSRIEQTGSAEWQVALFPSAMSKTAFVCYHKRFLSGARSLLPAFDAYLHLADVASESVLSISGFSSVSSVPSDASLTMANKRNCIRILPDALPPFATIDAFFQNQLRANPWAFLISAYSATLSAQTTSFSDSRLCFRLCDQHRHQHPTSVFQAPLTGSDSVFVPVPASFSVPVSFPISFPVPNSVPVPVPVPPQIELHRGKRGWNGRRMMAAKRANALGSVSVSVSVSASVSTPAPVPVPAPLTTRVPAQTCALRLSMRLGNHMFQIAALLVHCIRHGKVPVLILPSKDPDGTEKYYRETLVRCAPFVRHEAREPSDSWVRGINNNADAVPFAFQPIASDASVLHGYFQSSLYFREFEQDVFSFFESPPSVIQEARRVHGHLFASEECISTAIVVHVRRGDYCTSKAHGILTPDYFKRGIASVRQAMRERGARVRPRVLFFSDDPMYCQKTFAASELEYDVVCVDERREAIALYVMSRFRFYVISNSSFSWWAAKLGEPAAFVVAPRPWFGPTGPQDFDDVYESHWMQIRAY
jgi:hypothetical protein